MDTLPKEFDAIVLGTGLKEGIVSALMSVHGRKVLHIDRNDFYGGDCASLKLSQLYSFFGEDPSSIPKEFGKDSEWSIDLIPKFILSSGDLFYMLRHVDCLHYLEFGRVAGAFVYNNGVIYRVPATTKQALDSKLMGLFEKKRMANLFEYVTSFEENPSATSNLSSQGKTPATATCNEYFDAYKLSDSTKEFIGHAMALELDDEYLHKPALETFRRIDLYTQSLSRFGQSPFIYPLYGLGDLPQAFSRVAAVWGGIYMLNTPVTEILYGSDGKVRGIRFGDHEVSAPLIVGDPSYFPDLVVSKGRVGRAICILKGPIPECDQQSDVEKDGAGNRIVQTAHQVILPASQIQRKSDIYVSTQGYNHRTTPRNCVLGYVSGLVYGSKSDNRDELKAGFDILKKAGISKTFYKEYDLLEPKKEAQGKNIFISKSYDATSHFESTVADAIDMYQRITGEILDLTTVVKRQAPTVEDA